MDRLAGGQVMHSETNETFYLLWCGHNDLNPDLGTTARLFEERIAGSPIEEWWDEMDADAEERKFWERV